ncbi:MAG: Spy/CpxP family protein refolding chaperone [Moraxellaceae bacterium]|nr:Spy/CpxP family protein refolding chaperone [Moraxellaceae bacterium]MDZ4297596.1 Spy/CpxP family protein refolding chaperone [Moraxellaceae bacterium]MDZ4387577.1 Spy/CpxP family protein refolding chaperone [Moraxellaceae bacterium]
MKMRYILPLSLMLATTTVVADDHRSYGKADGAKYSEHRIERMDKHAELNLTDAQKAQLKAIMDETKQRHGEIRKQSDEKVNAVLTTEQRAKYAKHREQMIEKMKAKKAEHSAKQN